MDTLVDDLHALESVQYHNPMKVPKTLSWTFGVLPQLDNERFKQMMRMNRETFQYLFNRIKDDPEFHGQNSVLQTPIEVQLAIVLYRLGSYGDGGSIRKIASLFGVGDGATIERITNRIFKVFFYESFCNHSIFHKIVCSDRTVKKYETAGYSILKNHTPCMFLGNKKTEK